jgi:hypothetical protein
MKAACVIRSSSATNRTSLASSGVSRRTISDCLTLDVVMLLYLVEIMVSAGMYRYQDFEAAGEAD